MEDSTWPKEFGPYTEVYYILHKRYEGGPCVLIHGRRDELEQACPGLLDDPQYTLFRMAPMTAFKVFENQGAAGKCGLKIHEDDRKNLIDPIQMGQICLCLQGERQCDIGVTPDCDDPQVCRP
jgi:hypothetical protein